MKEEDSGEDTEGLTFIDTRNGFNKLSHLSMLWMVSRHWPLGARFALNFYWREAQLVLRRPESLCHLLTIREELTKGDPLLMVLYRLSLLPLAEAMMEADP